LPKLKIHDVLFWLAAAAMLLPWLYIEIPQSANADNLWLAEALRRWLGGQTMTGGLYEPNPPLALFLYAVPVLLHGAFGVPLHHAIFGYTLALLGLWSAALYAVLRRWDFLDPAAARVLLISFIAANTVMALSTFGERDHMLAMALVPFVTVQLALTFRLPCDKKLIWAVLAAGAVFILVKPHHGLLPVLLLAHRAFHRRGGLSSVIRDPDFICLAAATVLYIAGLFVLFPGYVSVILPEAVKFYLPRGDAAAVAMLTLRFAGAAAILLLLLARMLKKAAPELRALCGFLAAAAMVSLIPFVVQGRGYVYHLLPATSFLWMGLGLWTLLWLRQDTKKPLLSFGLAMAAIIGVAYIAAVRHQPPTPTNDAYRSLKLTRMAAACGQPRCAVFIFNQDEEIAQKIAYYANADYASRFPSYWFLSQLLLEQDRHAHGRPAGMTGAEIEGYRHKFAKMTAEDLARWKPQLALIGSFEVIGGRGPFDFVGWFHADRDFAREWAHYKKTGVVAAPFDDYLPGALRERGSTLTFDVYRRVKP
jgi:hypothetical protein